MLIVIYNGEEHEDHSITFVDTKLFDEKESEVLVDRHLQHSEHIILKAKEFVDVKKITITLIELIFRSPLKIKNFIDISWHSLEILRDFIMIENSELSDREIQLWHILNSLIVEKRK